MKDAITESQLTKPRWIDRSVMIADPLTKFGNSEFPAKLISTMTTGELDLTPSVSSEMRKLQQQRVRMNKIRDTDL